ncbi:multidrug resistance efflux pump [Luteibacter sp. OK325]|uniref:HlyD family secretion protein n=1 Tax=Luteibacter sp. OK325 TaxID=2135670 RepID=UPI000D3BC0AE|nr:HlyD family secretion protein [Luteibacter sp. OK325]PTR33960.1 multidrug resistance efflux pump [Luteibacter sp. OK325]
MSTQTTTDTAPPGSARTDDAAVTAAASAQRIRRLVRLALLVLLAMFLYHLFADRITPYTSQAAIDTFVVQIAPEVSGPVVSVEVSDNHEVKKGQVLFRIDPRPFQIALQVAQANVSLATQAADASVADVRVAEAQLSRQRVDLAASQQLGKIVLDLSAKRALSETSAIRARADIAKTRAEISRGEAETERARIRMGDTGNSNAQIRQALAALAQAELDLSHSTVVAPSDGVVTNLRLSPGQFASRGTPVLSFVANGPRWISAAMRENQLGRIASGNRAYVVFDDRPGSVYPAHVDSVGWGIAQGDEAPSGQLPTVSAPSGWLREPQRFPVRVVLDAPATSSAQLPPGRSGAQANVVVLTSEGSVMNPLARLWIRMVAMLSYLR